MSQKCNSWVCNFVSQVLPLYEMWEVQKHKKNCWHMISSIPSFQIHFVPKYKGFQQSIKEKYLLSIIKLFPLKRIFQTKLNPQHGFLRSCHLFRHQYWHNWESIPVILFCLQNYFQWQKFNYPLEIFFLYTFLKSFVFSDEQVMKRGHRRNQSSAILFIFLDFPYLIQW